MLFALLHITISSPCAHSWCLFKALLVSSPHLSGKFCCKGQTVQITHNAPAAQTEHDERLGQQLRLSMMKGKFSSIHFHDTLLGSSSGSNTMQTECYAGSWNHPAPESLQKEIADHLLHCNSLWRLIFPQSNLPALLGFGSLWSLSSSSSIEGAPLPTRNCHFLLLKALWKCHKLISNAVISVNCFSFVHFM